MSWIDNYPKRTVGNDLVGKKLLIFADKPPKDTNFKGMKEVIVAESGNTSLQYRLFATNTDIDVMVEAYKQMKPFTYVRPEGDKFAHAEIVRE